MHSSVLRAGRVVVLVILAASAAVAWAASPSPSPAGPRYARRGYLHCVDDGGDLYSFDPVWRVESFRAVDPATGLDTGGIADRARIDRLRTALLRRLGVGSLAEIPSEGAAEVNAIRSLGYI